MSEQAEAGAREALNAAARKYNYCLAIAAGCGLASVVVFAIAGHFDIGILFCVGLGLGVINSQLVATVDSRRRWKQGTPIARR